MRTPQALFAVTALVLLNACGGGAATAPADASAPAAVTPLAIGGIWRAQVMSAAGAPLSALVIVTEDGRFFSSVEDPTTHCANVAQGALSTSGNSLTGDGAFGQIDYTIAPTVQPGCAFIDGSVSGSTVVSGSFVPRSSLTLTFTNTTTLGTASASGPTTFTYDTLYAESSDLSTTAGNWMTQTGAVVSIDADGVIFSQDAKTGCVLNGQLSVVDPTYNAYSATVTYSNCLGGVAYLNGQTALGLVALNDQVTPNMLYMGYTISLIDGDSLMIATEATR
jgi:hypothetical protein